MAAVYYGELLGKEEIVDIGLLLTKYSRQEIDYRQFEESMANLGYKLDVVPIDSRKIMMLKDAQSFEERIKNKTIEAKDVHRFIATNDTIGSVSFLYDRLMIDTLAEYGDEFAMATRASLLRFERRFTRPVSPKKGK
jgi:hypothetical protein